MKTARQKFGEVLAFHFVKQHKSDRDVSDRCGVPIRDVERWRAGELVPDRAQWKRACQLVSRSLFGVSALHGDALKEQEDEREQAVRQLRANNGHRTTSNGVAVTNFGDKLVEAAIVIPEVRVAEPSQPTPVAETQRKPYPSQPPGARTLDAISERREYARSILMQRPKIPFRGPDGLKELLLKRFGVCIAEAECLRLREELNNDRIEREVASRLALQSVVSKQPVPDRPPPVAPPAAPVITASVNDAEVSAGVELIIGAIPGLMEMTIKVDDAGVASVDYSVRKVQVTTVSSQLTVRR